MNQQERSALEEYLERLVQVRVVNKDPEAEAMIRRAIRLQPDSSYLLVQRALLLERALDESRARIAQLEQSRTSGGTGFLEPASSAPLPGHAAYAGPMPASAGGAPSFLGQAAATAAGVAGGAFLFEGIQNLFDHHGALLADQTGAAGSLPEDVTINNYYESPDRFEDDQQSTPANSRTAADVDFGNEDDDLMI